MGELPGACGYRFSSATVRNELLAPGAGGMNGSSPSLNVKTPRFASPSNPSEPSLVRVENLGVNGVMGSASWRNRTVSTADLEDLLCTGS